jgi:septal ring factor EnvC (AmiA/AmiB activator)
MLNKIIMQKILLSFFFLLISVVSVFSQTKDELEKKRKEIQQEIAELTKMQNDVKQNRKASASQLGIIQNKIRKRYAVISNINQQVTLIEDNIFANNREIYRLEKQLDTLRLQYSKSIVYAYQNRSNYDMLNFVFSSASFNDAIRRIQYLKSYRNYREDQVLQINTTQKEIELRIASLSQNKIEKSNMLEEHTKEMKVLEIEKKEQNNYVQKLKAREKELSSEINTKKKLDRNIQNAISSIVKREIEAARKAAEAEAKRIAIAKANEEKKRLLDIGNSKTTTNKAPTVAPKPIVSSRATNVLESSPEVTKVSVGFENNKHNLPWPVEKAAVVSSFGKKKIEGTSLIEDNIGITISTVSGSPVKAVFEGIVSAIYDVAGSQTVTIKHGKYFTTYYNLSTINVKKLQEVRIGQQLGLAGVNEDGDGEILFVVNIESKFMDPEQWLKAK